MSRVELDEDAQQLRVVIPSIKRLPPNPHIGSGYIALTRALAPPSETTQTDSELSPEPRENKTLRYRLLACDQRSFLTGSAAADLQAAHILDAIRKDVTRKKVVEDFLTQQRLQPPDIGHFRLNDSANAILLESSLHVQWQLYGTFCFVPAEDDAKAMLTALRESNKEWEKYYDPFVDRLRPLDVSRPPFNRPLWDVIVLHPHALLPDGLALGIAKDRFFYVPGQSTLPTSQLTWTLWTASVDCHLCSNVHPYEPLPPFVATDVRAELRIPPVSSLAMVINANSKLQKFMQDHGPSATSRVKQFSELMSELVQEIFFVPEGVNSVAAPEHPLQVAQHAQSISDPTPSSQTVQPAEQSSGATYRPKIGPAYGVMEEASAPPSEDMLSSAVEYPEVPDTDGLTNTEFRLVSAQARDPHLSSAQRANAAMLMLFGTHPYEEPYVHGLQATNG